MKPHKTLPVIVHESSAERVDVQAKCQRAATDAYVIHAENREKRKKNEDGYLNIWLPGYQYSERAAKSVLNQNPESVKQMGKVQVTISTKWKLFFLHHAAEFIKLRFAMFYYRSNQCLPPKVHSTFSTRTKHPLRSDLFPPSTTNTTFHPTNQ